MRLTSPIFTYLFFCSFFSFLNHLHSVILSFTLVLCLSVLSRSLSLSVDDHLSRATNLLQDMPTPDMFASIKNNLIRSPRFNVSSGTDWRVETERIVPRWVDSMQKYKRQFSFRWSKKKKLITHLRNFLSFPLFDCSDTENKQVPSNL